MSVERRRHSRYDILAQIRVKRGRINYIMDVINLSLSGAFVSTQSVKQLPWFRVGQELELDLFATEELDNIRVEGKIVRLIDSGSMQEQGFGVEFGEMEEEARKKLKAILDSKRATLQPPPLPG